VQRFKHVFVGALADHAQWEVRLQIVRTLPLLAWTPKQRVRVIEILRRDVDHPQTFVRAWALDGLATLAANAPELLPEVERALAAFETSGKQALATRARHIRERLALTQVRAKARRGTRSDRRRPDRTPADGRRRSVPRAATVANRPARSGSARD
jgi:hypothetical protein